jgi:pheromone shutdown protein TraB
MDCFSLKHEINKRTQPSSHDDQACKATPVTAPVPDMSTLSQAEREQMEAEDRVHQSFLADQRMFEAIGIEYGQEFGAAIEEALALAKSTPRKLIAIDQLNARTVTAVTKAVRARDKQRAAAWRRLGRAARALPMRLRTAWKNSAMGRCNCKFCYKRDDRLSVKYSSYPAVSTRADARASDADFKNKDPLVHAALVTDRDVYMADSIAFGLYSTASKRSVAVVGMAHMGGIEDHLQNTYYFRLMNV